MRAPVPRPRGGSPDSSTPSRRVPGRILTAIDDGADEAEPESSAELAVEPDPAAEPDAGPASPRRPGRLRRGGSALWRSLVRPTTVLVMGSMVVGTAIRLEVPRGLWLDEAISVSEARLPYRQMLHVLATNDVHPPLYFTFLWGSIRLFGEGNLALRAPSIFFGVLLIPLVFLLGKEAYDRTTGALASIVVAIAPFTVWYSQEARMYSQLMVFSTLAAWAQVRVLRRGGWFPWLVYAVSSVAMIGTQYFGVWQLLAQQLIFVVVIVSRWRRERRHPVLLWGWVCTAVPMAAALLPLGLLMKQQFSIDQATGQAFGVTAAGAGTGQPSVYSIISNIVDAVFGFHSNTVISDISSFWPFAMLVGLALLGRRAKSVSYLLLVLVLVPLIGMFVLSEFKVSLGDVRYLSTTVPILLLLLARGITSLATGRRLLAASVGAMAAVMVIALADQQLSSTNPRRYDFREALQRVDAQARPGDKILFDPVNDELNTVTTFYSPKVKASPLTRAPTTKSGHATFVVASPVLMNGTDRATLYSALGSLAFRHHLAQHWVYPNVEVWVYR